MRQLLFLAVVGCDAPHLLATGSADASVDELAPDASTVEPALDASVLDASGVQAVWVDSCSFAFDYQQRSASAATLTSAVMFSSTEQLVAGEAGTAFVTNDEWATQTRVCPPVAGLVRELVRLDDQHALAITMDGEISLGAQAGRAWTTCATNTAGIDLRGAALARVTTAGTTTVFDVVAVGTTGTIVRGAISVGGSYACGPFVAVTSPTTYTLHDVAADSTTGIVMAVGRERLRSTDFGQTFTVIPQAPNYVVGVSSLGNGAGFLFRRPRTTGTPDTPWLQSSVDGDVLVPQAAFLSDVELTSITPIDAQHAWIFGRGYTATTSFGRVSLASESNGVWTEVLVPQPTEAALINPLGALVALDASHATWVGPSGQIVTTSDGQAWKSRTTGSATSIYDLQFVGSSATSVWAVNALGQVLRSDDAGSVWTAMPAADRSLNSIASPSDAVTFAVGTDGIIMRRTATGFEQDPYAFTTPSLSDIDCVDTARCYAVGLKRAFIEWDGAQWSPVPGITAATSTISAIDVIDSVPRRGIAVGAAGTTFTMLGGSWIEQPATAGIDFTHVALATDGSGLAFALGETTDGLDTPVRLRSTDFGVTWSSDAALPEIRMPRGITQDSADGSWYMLGYSSLYKSIDDGSSWQRLALPVSWLVQNDVAARGGHVFAVGNVGMVMHSATAGL